MEEPKILLVAQTVTSVVAFRGFLPQNFGRWEGPINVTLSFYESRLSDRATQRWWEHSNPNCCNRICLNFLHSRVVGMLKHPLTPAHVGATW